MYPNWIQRDIADHMNTMLPISKKSRLAQIRDKGTRKNPERKKQREVVRQMRIGSKTIDMLGKR